MAAQRLRVAEQSILSARLQKGLDWDWIAREIKSAKAITATAGRV